MWYIESFLPRKLRHIMVHHRLIIAAHRTPSIKQSSQQIAFDVMNLSSILSHTAQYILNVGIIELQEL